LIRREAHTHSCRRSCNISNPFSVARSSFGLFISLGPSFSHLASSATTLSSTHLLWLITAITCFTSFDTLSGALLGFGTPWSSPTLWPAG
jgi:hypothetical protein